jgi:hypothetical protein
MTNTKGDNLVHRLPDWRLTLPLAQSCPRCGARTRSGKPCGLPAMPNGQRRVMHPLFRWRLCARLGTFGLRSKEGRGPRCELLVGLRFLGLAVTALLVALSHDCSFLLWCCRPLSAEGTSVRCGSRLCRPRVAGHTRAACAAPLVAVLFSPVKRHPKPNGPCGSCSPRSALTLRPVGVPKILISW